MEAVVWNSRTLAIHNQPDLLSEKSLPHFGQIHLIQDNLNTHFLPSLTEAFGVRKARRLWKKIVTHYTPKHASCLNMAEIEINALSAQCLDCRIASFDKLHGEVAACNV